MDRGHTIETPNIITYSSMVSRNSMCIGLLLAYLHGVGITSNYMENLYLNSQCAEKIWFIGGNECGEDKGRVLLIFRALYCLKYSGFLCRSDLAAALRGIWLNPTVADPNVWIREAMRLDGWDYCELLLVYVDYIMIVSN